MKILKKIDTALLRIGEVTSAICMFAMVLIVTIAIACRWMHVQFIASDELARYVMIWSIYIGIILCTRTRAHVSVDIIPNLLRGKARTALMVFIQVVTIATLIWLFKLSIDLIAHAMGNGQKAPITKIPYWFMYTSMAIGFGMSAIHQIEIFIKDFFLKKKSELIDEAVEEGMVSE